ncbi:MAG TPA: CRISPR-associated endonuclease Cas3'', partial [Candidatus Wallbacteria bacterium]|nr:CRISPR-associated endonuclease Cas3'' [Candidatus Wallbacteria bacterium]
MIEYYAHSENDHNEKHKLSKHLLQTSEFAESFACNENFKNIFRITGLFHDLGKYQPDFQKYLFNGGRRGSVPHASWGAGYARLCGALESSIAIDGHHKGMPDNADWKNDTEPFKRNDIKEFENIVNVFISDTKINEAEIKIPNILELAGEFSKSKREIFIRYLFSSLTDSDWLSTEEHFEQEKFKMRVSSSLPVDEMIQKLENEFSKKSRNGEINQLRNAARDEVLKKSDMPCGFYSLALPTGMGKTLTSMAWALKHSKINGLKRIIIVLPFVNIIDQTADIFKKIFGHEFILEHHSSYNENNFKCDSELENYSDTQKRKELACENWDYPVIVTTTVQFFESLFSNKPSKCRKIHNIAESVVIFDEVQTLPKEVILPTLQILKDVQAIMNPDGIYYQGLYS